MKKPIKIQKVPKVERIRKGMGNSLLNSLMSPTSLHTTPIERLEIISESRNLLLIEMDRLKLPFISPSSPSSRTPMVITFFIWQFSRDGGDNGLFITQVPKVLYRFNVSWLNNFGDFNEFWLVGLFHWVFKRFNRYWNLQKGKFCVSLFVMDINLSAIV